MPPSEIQPQSAEPGPAVEIAAVIGRVVHGRILDTGHQFQLVVVDVVIQTGVKGMVLVAEKRISDVLNVWQEIQNQIPAAGLIVVGDGPERASLESSKQRGVQFAGNVGNVVDYMRAADAFVLPSDCEGLSNSMLEAMSVSLPCVVTAVGGAPDVITHKTNGWLYASGNLEELTEGLVTLLKDQALRDRLGSAARDHMKLNYDLDATTDKLCAFYRDLAQMGT